MFFFKYHHLVLHTHGCIFFINEIVILSYDGVYFVCLPWNRFWSIDDAIHHGNITAQGRRAHRSRDDFFKETVYRIFVRGDHANELFSPEDVLGGLRERQTSVMTGRICKGGVFVYQRCDREYFNKVSNGEVRNFLRLHRAKSQVSSHY